MIKSFLPSRPRSLFTAAFEMLDCGERHGMSDEAKMGEVEL